MSKYDTYKVSLTTNSTTKPLQREITVLFEEGDPTIDVIKAADLLLVSEADMGGADIRTALLDLPASDFRALIKEVWIEQMGAMNNNKKHRYADQIQNDLNAARNS